MALFLMQPPRNKGWLELLSPSRVAGLVVVALAIMAIILVRILRPVIIIRFGGLPTQRLGAFAISPETYLCERDAGFHPKRSFDIFYHHSQTCNEQLKKMWSRRLKTFWLARYLARANIFLPGGDAHKITWRREQERDVYGLLADSDVHISFTVEEERIGLRALKGLGVNESVPFICFHARDSEYLKRVFPTNQATFAHEIRNSKIETYIPAAEEMARRGHFAFRMGAIVEDRLSCSNPMVIDYAANHRSDFLDIFLISRCRFFICSASGIERVPTLFRRPVAYVNYIPLDIVSTWGPKDLTIPKKIFSRKEGRLLTFREILEGGFGRLISSYEYENHGLEPIDNTAEEITNLAIEMDERLNGIWQENDEDEERQRKFWSLYKPNDVNGVFLSRIGAKFLKDNQHLLD